MSPKYFEYYDVKPVTSIKQMLQDAVDDAGDHIAYRYRGENSEAITDVTYREFQETTFALGAALLEKGFGNHGQHIGIVAVNSYKWIVTYLTILQSASVFVPIDSGLPKQELQYVINHSDVSVLFYMEDHEEDLRAMRSEIPKIKLFIGLDRAEDDGNFLSFDKLLERGRSLDTAAYRALESDYYGLKDLVYTSGTTGTAKGVMLSEHNICSEIYYGISVSTVWGTGVSVLPYHHTYEAISGILVAIHKHVTLCINEKLLSLMRDLKEYKPNYIYLVPAFAEVFYDRIHKRIKKAGKARAFKFLIGFSNILRKIGIDLRKKFFKAIHDEFGGNMEKIVCGGAPIRNEIGKFFDDIGMALIGGYGITECSPVVSVNPDSFNDYRTAGCRLECIDWKIEDPSPEGIGEIVVKGDTVMLGYYKDPERTAAVLKDGWFYTGDYGYITEKEQLVITGRKKNLIVLSNGKNVYPEEIEGYLMEIPEIKEVVVRGLKGDKGTEEALMAEVYLDPEMEKLDEKALLKKIQQVLREQPLYKRIIEVDIRSEEFVKTTSRKIRR